MKRKSPLLLPVDPKRTKFELKPHRKSTDLVDTSESELDSLPLDLKLAILIKLPAKSLVNFRCVSKAWYSIIRSPQFSRTFMSISSTRPRFIVALGNGVHNSRQESLVFFYSFDEGDSASLVPNNFDMAMPGRISGPCTSVHGLLAFQANICNPYTEQFFELPKGGTKFVGYDPIGNQYKALALHLTNRKGIIVHKVLTLGQPGGGWRHIKPPTTAPYTPVNAGVSINGFVYYGAFSPQYPMNPGIVCFDVCSENLTYIKAPPPVVSDDFNSVFMEYKGKLASIVHPFTSHHFLSFDLWVLEDVDKHEWSKTPCVIPPYVWDSIGPSMSFPGFNKAGEMIMAPTLLPYHVQPFYILYYNIQTQNIRRVRLHGIGDNQHFRHSYGFTGECRVRIAPQHIESIDFDFFKNLIS